MAQDGVSAEVLYPSLGLRLFGMEDAELQEACFRVYNDWLLEYCSVALDRLLGVSLISAYDVDKAVAEMERRPGRGHQLQLRARHRPRAGLRRPFSL